MNHPHVKVPPLIVFFSNFTLLYHKMAKKSQGVFFVVYYNQFLSLKIFKINICNH
jgi:hypothetical protein